MKVPDTRKGTVQSERDQIISSLLRGRDTMEAGFKTCKKAMKPRSIIKSTTLHADPSVMNDPTTLQAIFEEGARSTNPSLLPWTYTGAQLPELTHYCVPEMKGLETPTTAPMIIGCTTQGFLVVFYPAKSCYLAFPVHLAVDLSLEVGIHILSLTPAMLKQGTIRAEVLKDTLHITIPGTVMQVDVHKNASAGLEYATLTQNMLQTQSPDPVPQQPPMGLGPGTVITRTWKLSKTLDDTLSSVIVSPLNAQHHLDMCCAIVVHFVRTIGDPDASHGPMFHQPLGPEGATVFTVPTSAEGSRVVLKAQASLATLKAQTLETCRALEAQLTEPDLDPATYLEEGLLPLANTTERLLNWRKDMDVVTSHARDMEVSLANVPIMPTDAMFHAPCQHALRQAEVWETWEAAYKQDPEDPKGTMLRDLNEDPRSMVAPVLIVTTWGNKPGQAVVIKTSTADRVSVFFRSGLVVHIPVDRDISNIVPCDEWNLVLIARGVINFINVNPEKCPLVTPPPGTPSHASSMFPACVREAIVAHAKNTKVLPMSLHALYACAASRGQAVDAEDNVYKIWPAVQAMAPLDASVETATTMATTFARAWLEARYGSPSASDMDVDQGHPATTAPPFRKEAATEDRKKRLMCVEGNETEPMGVPTREDLPHDEAGAGAGAGDDDSPLTMDEALAEDNPVVQTVRAWWDGLTGGEEVPIQICPAAKAYKIARWQYGSGAISFNASTAFFGSGGLQLFVSEDDHIKLQYAPITGSPSDWTVDETKDVIGSHNDVHITNAQDMFFDPIMKVLFVRKLATNTLIPVVFADQMGLPPNPDTTSLLGTAFQPIFPMLRKEAFSMSLAATMLHPKAGATTTQFAVPHKDPMCVCHVSVPHCVSALPGV